VGVYADKYYMRSVRKWLSGKAETFADAFAKAAGTSLGSYAGPIAFVIVLYVLTSHDPALGQILARALHP
jgi:hypothetical protein